MENQEKTLTDTQLRAKILGMLKNESASIAKSCERKAVYFVSVSLRGFSGKDTDFLEPRLEIFSKKTFSDGSGGQREWMDAIYLFPSEKKCSEEALADIRKKLSEAKTVLDILKINSFGNWGMAENKVVESDVKRVF